MQLHWDAFIQGITTGVVGAGVIALLSLSRNRVRERFLKRQIRRVLDTMGIGTGLDGVTTSIRNQTGARDDGTPGHIPDKCNAFCSTPNGRTDFVFQTAGSKANQGRKTTPQKRGNSAIDYTRAISLVESSTKPGWVCDVATLHKD
jgi:hypothetical protein